NYTGATTVNAGTLSIGGTLGSSGDPAGAITASGGTLNVNGAAIYAPSLTQNSNGGNVFLFSSGTISLSGALGVNADNDDSDGVVSLAGGTLAAASATIGRDGDNLGSTAPTAGSTTDGLYVDGATVAIATTLGVGYFNGAENSSGQMRIDAGSVTVGGITTVSNDAGSRFSLLDLNGGAFTDNDPSGTGIMVGGSADASLDAELLVRGTATLNTPAITLGNASDTGGLLEFMDIGGTTYLGAGGIASTAPSNTTVTIALGSSAVATAPVLAASANWSSSRPMTLTNSSAGTAVTFQAANASSTSENITLSGVLSGTGGLTKSGAGTLTLSGANTYTGTTTVSAGTLNVTGSLAGASLTVQSGAILSGNGSIAAPLAVQSGGGLLLNSSGNPVVTGNVTFSGSVVVTAAPNLPVGNYTLLTYTGALSGSPAFSYVPPSGASQAANFSTATSGVVTVTVFGPPSAPTGLTATAGNGNVTLNWTASSGATGYTVQRSTTSGGGYTTLATGVTSSTYKDTTAVNGTTYYYVVVATNTAGSSDTSAQASSTPLPPPPATPTGLTATAGNGNVTLNWTAVSGAASYLVQRSTTSGSGYLTVNGAVATNSYTDLGLVNGTTYYYVVAASNAGGTSANSTEVSATPAETFSQWTNATFPGQTNPAVTGPTANPSGDGIPNLLKYFFGLDPAVNAGSPPVTSAPDNSGNLVLSFRLSKNLTGVIYQIQSSPDMMNWSNTGIQGVEVSDQGTYYQMQAAVPMGANPQLYLRVSVSQSP
ncbi:MAG: autotransporter-associated beta strand repeat-containing protein, partial [Opitutales bacterium]